MTAPGSVRKIFKTAFQQVYKFKEDVNAGNANAAATKNLQKAGSPRSA